jgi:hypothetical protein
MKVLKPPQSGSQNGTTASHNRFGQYERTRAMPVQPVASPRRAQVRANFTAASAGWAILTMSEQEAWNSYAGSHPRTDSLGQSIVLTGHQMYVAISSQLLNIGQTPSNTPPSDDSLPSVIGLVVYADATGNVGCRLDAAGAGYGFLISASRPVSGGVTFMSTFRQFMVTGTLQTLVDISEDFTAAYGLPAVGGRIFFGITPVNQQGVVGTRQRVICEVVAASTLAAPALTGDPPGAVLVNTSGATTPDVVQNAENVGITPDEYIGELLAVTTGVSMPSVIGDNVYVRLFDGAQFSPRSNVFPVT